MGNSFAGGYFTSGVDLYLDPKAVPSPTEKPTYNDHLGFPGKRQPRKMIATEDELRAAKIPLRYRDYCAHLLIKFRACRRKNFPWVVACEHEKHEYAHCEYEDFVLRMKEYERERRLRKYQKDKSMG